MERAMLDRVTMRVADKGDARGRVIADSIKHGPSSSSRAMPTRIITVGILDLLTLFLAQGKTDPAILS